MDGQHWLIWDGDCDLCRNTVAWISRHDRQGRFRAVPFQDCPSPPMTPALKAQARRAVQVITAGGRRLAAGRAALFVLEEIGWHPALARLGRRRPFVWLVGLGYVIVARNRPFFARFLFRVKRER